MNPHIEAFISYSNQMGDRMVVYRNVIEHFKVESILYPGSHIDINPSFLAPKVTYIDNFKATAKFFKRMDIIIDYINQHKEYEAETKVAFLNKDYEEAMDIDKVDMIISQYAGFVGQATKQYLKKDGVLLCNDSHGDATLAYLDNDYEFIAIINNKKQISAKDLSKFFKFARPRKIDLEKVKKTMKGPKYKFQAISYIFKKVV
ncbi:MAG TPA: hypothetical protein VJ878_02525 [Candidatus Izemoplasmatales bacterium]|nr:hypothetical protein [Candidatus Izemoplasmatales bacterium]